MAKKIDIKGFLKTQNLTLKDSDFNENGICTNERIKSALNPVVKELWHEGYVMDKRGYLTPCTYGRKNRHGFKPQYGISAF